MDLFPVEHMQNPYLCRCKEHIHTYVVNDGEKSEASIEFGLVADIVYFL